MAAREHRFVQVDVFTDRPYAGNALAVVFEAEGIAGEEMQAIAREMNLSETTFVLRPTRPECAARIRIFTPGQELPFAGHPTIGSSIALAREGLVPAGTTEFLLEEGIGPVPVRLEGDPTAPHFAWMHHGEATFGPEITDRGGMAAALGLSEPDLFPGVPIQTGSTGLPHLYVTLRDRAVVDRAVVDVTTLRRVLGDDAQTGIFVFAPDPDPASGHVYSRMFAPLAGIPEDPATGSASGPLGVYCVRYGLIPKASEVRIVSEQGVKMGRPSLIHIRLRMDGDAVIGIEVGGSAVPVLEGTLRLP